MESLEQFFKDNQRGYPRDPRRMAYTKLQKNTQGMDREQLEAFITANLFIPHSQYKMALGNLIQFLKKQDQMSKLNEVKQFQKIAGLINENWHPDDPASVDMDDMEDEDPEDFDDISERKKSDLSDYIVKNDDGKFYIDQEDPDTGEAVGIPGDSFVFTYKGRKHRATVTNKGFGRNGVYLLRLAGEDDDIFEDADYESESGDTNAMGDTDAMNVSEAGNIKGIKIEIPGNSYASDFGKAAAREVVESFGPREYRNFLEAFLNEFKKITGGV
jgi:hypothetical protein